MWPSAAPSSPAHSVPATGASVLACLLLLSSLPSGISLSLYSRSSYRLLLFPSVPAMYIYISLSPCSRLSYQLFLFPLSLVSSLSTRVTCVPRMDAPIRGYPCVWLVYGNRGTEANINFTSTYIPFGIFLLIFAMSRGNCYYSRVTSLNGCPKFA
jgi:hypothetical protein